MKTDPQFQTTAEAPAETAPARTVEGLMATFPMRGTIRIPRHMRAGVTMLCLVLTATLILGAVLLIGGGAAFWQAADASPAPTPEPPSTTTALLPMSDQLHTISPDLIGSANAVVADLTEKTVIASHKGDEIIFPASMTKVMTLIVAVENLPDESSLQEVVTISRESYDRMVAEGASGVGLDPGEKLTVEALLYCLILQSDGIASCELARHIAGSEAAFVGLMNQKAEDMGLTNTHFENTTGLHHKNHVSTAREIASIMAYAMHQPLCRKILSAKQYNAPFTMVTGEQKTYNFYHTLLVTQFNKIQPNQPTALKLIAGKTGYTPESGYCLVTYAESSDGHAYVCVTADASNKYAGCIKDYITLYDTYAGA